MDEVEFPWKTVPKAVRRVVNRLNIYYLGAIFVLTLNVSSDDSILQAAVSGSNVNYQGPFVLMAQRAGLPRLGDFLTVMALGAAFCVFNAAIYISVMFSSIAFPDS